MTPERDEREITLGPFFSAGVLLVAYGLRRRRRLPVAAGLGSIWLDQRSALGRSLKARIRARSAQLTEDAVGRADRP